MIGLVGNWLGRGEQTSPANGASMVETVPGVLILGAWMGGLRTPMGDLVWLQSNRHWAREDALSYLRTLDLVHWLRPEALHYWIEGARTVAYDLPHWDGADQQGLILNAHERLERARRLFPENEFLLATSGEIALQAEADAAKALAFFREAAAVSEDPEHLLRAIGYLEDKIREVEHVDSEPISAR